MFFQSEKFKSAIGEGYCFTDNGIVRVVIDDCSGHHAFRRRNHW